MGAFSLFSEWKFNVKGGIHNCFKPLVGLAEKIALNSRWRSRSIIEFNDVLWSASVKTVIQLPYWICLSYFS